MMSLTKEVIIGGGGGGGGSSHNSKKLDIENPMALYVGRITFWFITHLRKSLEVKISNARRK